MKAHWVIPRIHHAGAPFPYPLTQASVQEALIPPIAGPSYPSPFLPSPCRVAQTKAKEAVLLDMGEYMWCPPGSEGLSETIIPRDLKVWIVVS